MKFHFEEYKVILKTGLVRLLVEWSNSETSSSILYDSRFVQLLVVSIFSGDEIISNKLDKKKMNFIKGNCFPKTTKQIESNDFMFYLNLTYVYLNDSKPILLCSYE